jgi:chaperonin GroES
LEFLTQYVNYEGNLPVGVCKVTLASLSPQNLVETAQHLLSSTLTSNRWGQKSSKTNQTQIISFFQAAVVKRLIPMFDRVLIQRAEALTKTKGGIVIPEKAQAKVLEGTIVAVGPGARNKNGDIIPLTVQVGDKVLLPEYGGTKVELEDNKEFHLFRESDILAKLG